MAAGTQPCTKFGIHPALSVLQQLYEQGDAVLVANVGALLEPLDKAGHEPYSSAMKTCNFDAEFCVTARDTIFTVLPTAKTSCQLAYGCPMLPATKAMSRCCYNQWSTPGQGSQSTSTAAFHNDRMRVISVGLCRGQHKGEAKGPLCA